VNIIVVGCGRVGAELAPMLEQAGNIVTVIDKNASAFGRLPAHFTGRRIHGSGFDRDDLAAAGIESTDALAAVTAGDNTNILTARIAREVFEVPHVVARIYDPRRAVIYERLGIPTVATVTWTTDQVLRRLDPSKSAVEWTAATGDVLLVERMLTESWAGRSLLSLTQPGSYMLVSVRRGATTLLASPDMVGQPGDIAHFAVARGATADLAEALDRPLVRGGAH
jgi:trk system potassium uptake protein TrkA